METATSQHFGEIALAPAGSRAVAGSFTLDGAAVELDLNITDQDRLDEASLHKVDYRLRFLHELVESARELIGQELDEQDSAADQYRRFHCQNLRAGEAAEVFGVEHPEDISKDVFLRALRLAHVGIFPGQPERYFVLDFTLGRGFTDEVLVAAADADGLVDDEVLWE
ncbi:DUF2004 domain-containing protein [Sinomonas cellulolyticus]|uniref:DUF2004 domain-containing protein n=1 Tax=Sinomonas cellulolyticus TaxID=2801916 RepID=A0ABS1K0S3_9MICC|nr:MULTISPECIES: DUF2004 domain-containing protein [Sinomonas]MBL0705129.1 DUF2004 domain-containing protein [Sinomonas cellulolyticus]